jgi:putative ATP-dependent endonuclease of OLD family
MLDRDGKSGLKAIVAQCFASILRWEVSKVPDGVTKEQMFDLDIYQFKVDEAKKVQLKERIEADQYLKYIVDAIKYAVQQ